MKRISQPPVLALLAAALGLIAARPALARPTVSLPSHLHSFGQVAPHFAAAHSFRDIAQLRWEARPAATSALTPPITLEAGFGVEDSLWFPEDWPTKGGDSAATTTAKPRSWSTGRASGPKVPPPPTQLHPRLQTQRQNE